jgi:hypothetical protein
MTKFFCNYKVIFYSTNFFLIFLYLFPGSVLGWLIYDDKRIQPQITSDFIVSSNHFYVFIFVTMIGFFTFKKKNQIRILTVYLIILSIILEIFHLVIPDRSFQWSDLFGNLFGVFIVIFFNKLINKYVFF